MLSLLQDFAPNDAIDERFLIRGVPFSSKHAYSLFTHEQDEDPDAPLIWNTKVPIKVQIFGWLLFKGRLNSKSNLFNKNIAPNSSCPRCDALYENALHMFIQCPAAAQVWQALSMPTPFDLLWGVPSPDGLDNDIWPSVALSIL